MTPFVKIPTKEVYDTTLPKLYHKATTTPRPLSRLRLDVTDPSDVARMRPREYQPARPFAPPVRAYSDAFRAVGGEVVRVQQQDYK